MTWHENPAQVEWRDDPKQNWNWKWFAVYCWFGKHYQ